MHAIFFRFILFFFDSIVFACARPFLRTNKTKFNKIKVEKSTSPPPNFKGCSPYKSPEPEQQQQQLQQHGKEEYSLTGPSSLNNTSTNVPSPNLLNNNLNLSSNKSDDLILNNQSTQNNVKQSTRPNRRIGRHESRYTSGKNLSKINVDFRNHFF